MDFERTSLWRRTLGDEADDSLKRERESLRIAYLQFRGAVEPLANEIALSMPMFTDHSIAHIDALWDVASIICGDDYSINPAEAFVLGGAFLLHDLGMGLVAYPGGVEEVKKDAVYEDYFLAARARIEKEHPSIGSGKLESLATDDTIATILRVRHAKRAERLVTESFRLPDGSSTYLLQDARLRVAFGSIIGRIAHSHWFDVDDLAKEFGQIRGSLAEHPPEWCIDPLKIACLLRVADAAHIDSRRAPTFLHAFRNPTGPSREHWDFQQRLTRPRLVGDRLEYTSTVPFSAEDVGAWWLAYETIGLIDSELRRTDALSADLGRERFAARSVAGADSPARLANYLPTDQWVPIDASLSVSNVPHLVATLGGQALYGQNNLAPVRELIANAADATRARQVIHGGGDASVVVKVINDGEDMWLEVSDHGIGMDPTFLVNCLTDFGTSYWQSRQALAQNPHLLSRGFRSAGRFGIGFFSIFMIAEFVSVRSLKYFDPPSQTHVLEFRDGLQTRPLLRQAKEEEQIRFGGTVVRAKLKNHPIRHREGFLYDHFESIRGVKIHDAMKSSIASLCALADVDIEVMGPEAETPELIVRANDWKHMPPGDLFERVYPPPEYQLRRDRSYPLGKEAFVGHVSEILDSSSEVVGRLALHAPMILSDDEEGEVVMGWTPGAYMYVGGMRADSIRGISGVVMAKPLKADRSQASPLPSRRDFELWAHTQLEALAVSPETFPYSLNEAHVARFFNLPVRHLPCGITAGGYVSLAALNAWAAERDTIEVLSSHDAFVYHNEDETGVICFRTGRRLVVPATAFLTDFDLDYVLPDDFKPTEEYLWSLFGKAIGFVEDWWTYRTALSTPRYVLAEIANSWGLSVDKLVEDAEYLDLTFEDDERFLFLDEDGRVGQRISGFRLKRASSSPEGGAVV